MSFSKITFAVIGLTALSLGACSTSGERLSGLGAGAIVGGSVAGAPGAVVGGSAGAIEGPHVAHAMGVPHRRWHRHWRRHPQIS